MPPLLPPPLLLQPPAGAAAAAAVAAAATAAFKVAAAAAVAVATAAGDNAQLCEDWTGGGRMASRGNSGLRLEPAPPTLPPLPTPPTHPPTHHPQITMTVGSIWFLIGTGLCAGAPPLPLVVPCSARCGRHPVGLVLQGPASADSQQTPGLCGACMRHTRGSPLCPGAVELAMLIVGRLCLGFGIGEHGSACRSRALPARRDRHAQGARFRRAPRARPPRCNALPGRRPRCCPALTTFCAHPSAGFVNQVAPLYLSEMAPIK